MAISKVVEQRKDRTAEYTQTGRSYTRSFYVHTTDPDGDYPANIFEAVDPVTSTELPSVGDEYPSDERAVVRSVTPNQLSDKGDAYQVIVRYDTRTDYAGIRSDSLDYVENPIDRSPEVSWTFERFPEVATSALGRMDGYAADDWSSKTWTTPTYVYTYNPSSPTTPTAVLFADVPIENTVGQEFDPPIMRDVATIVGVLTRNELEWNGTQALEYLDVVNSDNFAGFSPGMARMHSISATRMFESGLWYWRVRYEVHIRNHWYRVIPNVGLCYKYEDALYAARDIDDFPLSQPIRLDESGEEIPIGDPTYYRVFKMHESKPFAPLDLE